MKWLIHWKANRNYNTDFFFLLDIFVLNTPFSSPKVSLRTSSEGGKHWAVFFPPQTQNRLLALNGTLCASLLVFEWVWGHTETRLGPVLQWEGFARYLPKWWIHRGLEWNRKPCPEPESSDAPGTCMQALRRTACLAPMFFLSIDLPCCCCCCCCCDTVVLSKYNQL